jgi:hypothetical protein
MTARPETAPGGHYRGVSDGTLIRRIRATGKTPFQIRAWAEQHGIPVPARGVIVDEHVLDAYETEHQEAAPCPPTTPRQRSPQPPSPDSQARQPAATGTSKTPKRSSAPSTPTTTPGTATASATPGPAPTPTTSTSSTTPTPPSATPTTADEQPPTTETPSSADEHARLTAAGVSSEVADVLTSRPGRILTLGEAQELARAAAARNEAARRRVAGVSDGTVRRLDTARARSLGVRGLPIDRLFGVVAAFDDLFATTTDPLLTALAATRAELERLTRRTA